MSTPTILQKFGQRSKASEIRTGIFIGLIPLVLLVILLALAFALTAIVRQTSFADGFFVWRQNALITLLVGLGVAVVVYIVALVRIMRRVAMWQRNDMMTRSTTTLWTLSITALLVLLPVILAVVIPQTPAP